MLKRKIRSDFFLFFVKWHQSRIIYTIQLLQTFDVHIWMSPTTIFAKRKKILAWFRKRYFLKTSVLVRLHQRWLYTSDLPKHLTDGFFWDQKPFSKTIEVLFDHSENQKPFWRYCCFAISHREKGFTPTKWTKSDVQVVQTQKLHLKTNIRRSQYAEN